MSLRLERYQEREDLQNQETKIILMFMDSEGKLYRLTSTKGNAKVWSIVCGMNTAKKSHEELWITNYKLRPGTVEIEENSDFKVALSRPGFVPIDVKTKELNRKDWK